jgi:hypothetical protein
MPAVGLFEKNHILRVLEELTERMSAARTRVAGGDPAGALAEVLESRKALAGSMAGTLERMDGGTVVALLGAERARGYAALSRLEGEARAALGQPTEARRAEGRADEIERALG